MQRYSFSNYTHTQILSEKEACQAYIPTEGRWELNDSYEVLHMKNNNHASRK